MKLPPNSAASVTAAGTLDQQDFLEMTEETFDRTIGIDLKGVFLSGRFAAPHMVTRGGGCIINIASQTAIKGAVSLAHYVAAKAGVIGMTKSMALDLAEHNILVNAIAPGPIETPLFGGITQQWRDEKQKELPIGHFGKVEEVAPTALLLASSLGGDIYTGQTLGPNSGDVMPLGSSTFVLRFELLVGCSAWSLAPVLHPHQRLIPGVGDGVAVEDRGEVDEHSDYSAKIRVHGDGAPGGARWQEPADFFTVAR